MAKADQPIPKGPRGRPLFRKLPDDLKAHEVDLVVDLDPMRECTHCGHVVQVAKVVRWKGDRYAYSCLGCAVRT